MQVLRAVESRTIPAAPRLPGLHGVRDGVPRLLDAPLWVQPEEEERAEDEEDDQADDGGPVGAAELEDQAEEQDAEPRRAALEGVVEGEVLALAAAGDQQAEERPRERLGAAEH